MGKKSTQTPSFASGQALAETFNEFFIEKIRKIKCNQDLNNSVFIPDAEPKAISSLEQFDPFAKEEIKAIIMKLSNASCELDPIPIKLLKLCIDSLLDPITCIVNMSLRHGSFPKSLKHALVRPTLKKHTLDPDTLKNYRPVSNLPTLSKVIEKAVVSRLEPYLSSNMLTEKFQSAYRPGYSTETALVRITNDILADLDRRRGVILVMLDLSAAFDTLDYKVLLTRLEQRLGIRGTALRWFSDYHSGRTQSVVIDSFVSTPIAVESGGPQGSVLGAEDYKMYTSPVGDIIRKHGMRYSIYADDSTKYLSFTLEDDMDIKRALDTVNRCVTELKNWMTINKLQLNEEKTEVVVFSPRNKPRPNITTISVCGSVIPVTLSARNIGVILDSSLSMAKHVSNVCSVSMFHLRRIAAIRDYITKSACEKLAHSLIALVPNTSTN